MDKINISIKSKNYVGGNNTHFKFVSVDKDDLENISKTYDYSLITWKIDEEEKNNEYNRKRKSENFESALDVVIDIDENLTIYDAVERLKQKNYNHVIVTSRNHQQETYKEGKFSPAQDRYHILLFFNKEVTDPGVYSEVFSYFATLFPNLDTKCKSLDRFLFGSPTDTEYYSWFDREDVNVDEIKVQELDFLNMPKGEDRNLWEFNVDDEVTLARGKVVRVVDIKDKQPCHCMRPEHPDRNPSAFIKYDTEKDKWMSYCSGCGNTGWSKFTKKEYQLIKQIQNFYYLGKDIYEVGIAEDKFFLTKNSEKNFFYTIGAEIKDKQESALKNLIKNRRLRTLTRVDYVGNPEIDESYYTVNALDGIVSVNIAAIRTDVIDNKFIEDYLNNTFGQYKDFVKQ